VGQTIICKNYMLNAKTWSVLERKSLNPSAVMVMKDQETRKVDWFDEETSL